MQWALYEQKTTTYLSVHDEGFVGVSEVTTARVADASIGLNVEELQWVLGRLEHDGAVVLHTHAKLAVRPALALQTSHISSSNVELGRRLN